MSPLASKAIVITYPKHGKHGSITVPTRKGEFSVLDFDSDGSNSGGPRKRRRLTHLSPDEKLLRRKLKNRMAAQTARDRKKALMVELEDKVAMLEEENRSLKLQNLSLKKASCTLAKENAALRSQLTDKSLSTTKTDSGTKRSAAPAVPLPKEQVQNLPRWVSENTVMPDNFLGLLQELAKDGRYEWSQTQAATSFPQSACRRSNPDNIKTNQRHSASGMVGLTPAELESLNELISIDHIYVKPQPRCLERVMDGGQQKSTASVSIEGKSNIMVSPQNKCCVSLSESKRECIVDLNCGSVSQAQASIPSVTSDMKLNKLNLDCTSSAPSSSQSLLSSQLDVTGVNDVFTGDAGFTDDLMSLLSHSNIDTSLNIFHDFGSAMFETNTQEKSTMHNSQMVKTGVSVSADVNQTGEGAVSDDEKNATKLFNEIYEHYLSIKNCSSPDSAILNDTRNGSDHNGMSPQSSGESLHDMWHETSFADLLPDFQ